MLHAEEEILDRIEVRRVRREREDLAAFGVHEVAHSGSIVERDVVMKQKPVDAAAAEPFVDTLNEGLAENGGVHIDGEWAIDVLRCADFLRAEAAPHDDGFLLLFVFVSGLQVAPRGLAPWIAKAIRVSAFCHGFARARLVDLVIIPFMLWQQLNQMSKLQQMLADTIKKVFGADLQPALNETIAVKQNLPSPAQKYLFLPYEVVKAFIDKLA